MLAVVGTIPDQNFPLVAEDVGLKDDAILIGEHRVLVSRGTPALLAAAIKAGEPLGGVEIKGYLAGDIGLGDGSRRLYKLLADRLGQSDFKVITFHYLQPNIDWHNRVLFAVEDMKKRPCMIADAGFMYAAKMSGQSKEYDLFTPDVGEMAFLADETAPHPFYTRGFILHEENKTPDLIARAYKHKNASKFILVKGKKDYLAGAEGIETVIDYPMDEAMEAIGGTGDTLTGIVSALISSGFKVKEAAVAAAKANRLAGRYAGPTPATQVIEIIRHIPRALADVLNESDIQ